VDVSGSTASSGLVTDSQKDVGRKKGMIRSPPPSGLPRDADDSDFESSLSSCLKGRKQLMMRSPSPPYELSCDADDSDVRMFHDVDLPVDYHRRRRPADSVAAVPARKSPILRQATVPPRMVHPVSSMRVRSRVNASVTKLGMTSVPHLGENVLLALVKLTE